MFSVRTPSYKLNANMSFIVLKVPVCICEGGGCMWVDGVLDLLRHFDEHKKKLCIVK